MDLNDGKVGRISLATLTNLYMKKYTKTFSHFGHSLSSFAVIINSCDTGKQVKKILQPKSYYSLLRFKYIWKTGPCNIQRFFSVVKIKNYKSKLRKIGIPL